MGKPTKPKPKTVELVKSSYQPTKAEMEEEFSNLHREAGVTKRLVAARVVRSIDRRTLHGFAKDHVDSDATVCARDSLPFQREKAERSVSEYVLGKAHTNGTESFRSVVERADKGAVPPTRSVRS